MSYEKIVICDLPEAQLRALLPTAENYLFIDANAKAAHCIGCFGCWLKTPSECVLKDRLQHMGAAMAMPKAVVVVSQNCYGGYSPGVKKVFDRSISCNLPFFTYRKGQIHHVLRYKNRPSFTAYFYGEVNGFEQEIAQNLVQANSINMGCHNAKAFFMKEPAQLREVWQ